MLLQAATLVRLINSITSVPESDSFIGFAIYIDKYLTASRYLVYQAGSEVRVCFHGCQTFPHFLQIKYVAKEFNLKTPGTAIAFFQELYNYPHVASHNLRKLHNVGYRSLLCSLQEKVSSAGYPAFITTSRSADTKESSSNQTIANSTTAAYRLYDDPLVARAISAAGFTLPPRLKLPPGWAPLHPVCFPFTSS